MNNLLGQMVYDSVVKRLGMVVERGILRDEWVVEFYRPDAPAYATLMLMKDLRYLLESYKNHFENI